MRALARAIDGMELPAVEKVSESQSDDPFQVLIATLLSARTQDATTLAASTRLFSRARTPAAMAKLSVVADRAVDLSGKLLSQQSPVREGGVREDRAATSAARCRHTLDEMVTLPGVGRKTANLVMILAYKSQQNICVDTHVHRIANRLGWVKTRLPEETEQALYRATDSRWWPLINLYLVTWGQNVCRPVFPRCGDCGIASLCPRIGVSRTGKSRQAKASDVEAGL